MILHGNWKPMDSFVVTCHSEREFWGEETARCQTQPESGVLGHGPSESQGCCKSLSLVFAVDLRLLQLVGIIHVDRLPLGVEINRADSAFAMAVAGGLRPAEWQVHFRAAGGGVGVGGGG